MDKIVRHLCGFKFALVFLLLMGCAALNQLETARAAKRHMLAAAKLEDDRQFHEAVREYVYVAINYPDSGYCKPATFKAAMLLGSEDNPKRNLEASQYWLKEYLKLPLSEHEQDRIRFLIALIEENTLYQTRISELQAEVQIQRALISQSGAEISALESLDKKRNLQIREIQERLALSEEKIKERHKHSRQLQEKLSLYEETIRGQEKQIHQLETEISRTRNALERLKEIDVRTHQRRLK